MCERSQPITSHLLQPAIELAEDGFVIRQGLIDDMEEYQKVLQEFPSTIKVLQPNGRWPMAGEIFRQPLTGSHHIREELPVIRAQSV
jgi:gamma-glutamyltranspeptidase